MKTIPKEDCLVAHVIPMTIEHPNVSIDEYPDCVFCECGADIYFKTDKLLKGMVRVICPECGHIIHYGGSWL